MKKKFTLVFILLLFFIPSEIFGEEILISKSDDMDDLKLDGVWSFYEEWKRSSYDRISFGENILHVRSAHQGDFIYFLLDFELDDKPNYRMDKAILCLDGGNDKNKIPDKSDFCFISSMKGKSSHILQGGSSNAVSSYFEKIKNHDDFVALGNISGKDDRYSKTPHPSYEFKIPTDLIGRYSEYGLYFAIYEYSSNSVYTWPKNLETNSSLKIPSPSLWGILISPDKSIPEFSFSFILYLIIPLSVGLLFITKTRFRTITF